MKSSVLAYLLAWGILFFGQLPSQGQNKKIGFDPIYPIHQLIMDQWTNENGLVSSNLTSVYQSSNGYIWTTSHSGLQRFEGHKFRSYTTKNVPVLSSDSFYRIFERENDSLWFTTERSGIVGMHKNRVFQFAGNDQIPKAIITMNILSNGNMYIGSKNRGLFFKNSIEKIVRIKQVPEVTINHIREDSKGNIWVATDGIGLYKISNRETRVFSSEDGLASNVINHIEIDKDDNIYVSTIEGANVIVDESIEEIDELDGLDINQMISDDYGTFWIAAEQGLARWHPQKQIFELFTETDGLPGRQVSGLVFDKEGSLWVTTKKAGLVRFRPGRIVTVSTKNGLSSDKINIVAKNNGSLFIGTDNGEINVSNDNSFNQVIYDVEFQDAGIRDFLFDSNGKTWVVNYNGVLVMDGKEKTLFNVGNQLPSNEVRRIFEDSQQRIWIGTRTGGLVNFNLNSEHVVYNKPNGKLGSNYIMSVEEDLNGKIVIGTNAGGLSLIDKSSNVITYHIKEDDSGILIFNTHVDHENGYLLCTNIGLFYFIDEKFKSVTIGEGIESKTFFDLVDDRNGGYWLTSNFGIIRISQEDVAKYLDGQIEFVEYQAYDDQEGMLNNECTGATRSFYDEQDGKIYVPTFEGVAVVDPLINLSNKKLPEVYITEMQIDEEQVDFSGSKVNVNPGAFRYTFDFTSLSYLSPSKVRFKYKLEGIDKDWIGPVSSRSVEYTNLPHGNYTFRVKGSNNEGLWNEQGASLTFGVSPYFYETIWFYLIGIVSIFIILLLIYKWRVKDITQRNLALGKINSELDRFVYSASHDLRAPLASTLGLVNIAKMEKSPELKDEYIGLIEQCVNKMDHFISDIIDFSRNKNKEIEPTDFDVRELIVEIFDDLKYLNHSGVFSTDIQISGGDMIFTDKLRIKMILSNLIANAIIYRKENETKPMVKVSVSSEPKSIKLSVEDNGIGIADKQKGKVFNMFYRANQKSKGSGLGLYIVKETLDKLDGQIQMSSELGKGTSFFLSIPKR